MSQILATQQIYLKKIKSKNNKLHTTNNKHSRRQQSTVNGRKDWMVTPYSQNRSRLNCKLTCDRSESPSNASSSHQNVIDHFLQLKNNETNIDSKFKQRGEELFRGECCDKNVHFCECVVCYCWCLSVWRFPFLEQPQSTPIFTYAEKKKNKQKKKQKKKNKQKHKNTKTNKNTHQLTLLL